MRLRRDKETAMKKQKEKPKANLAEIDDDIKTIAICAVRYAIGRQTYMPGLVIDFIRRHPEIVDEKVRVVMLRDIEENDRINEYDMPDGTTLRVDGLGSTIIDRPGWERFRDWLKGLKLK